MLRYFSSEECLARVLCVDEHCRARALCVDRPNQSLRQYLLAELGSHLFIAVKEVLAAHIMVIFYAKLEGMLRDVCHRSLVLRSLGNQ